MRVAVLSGGRSSEHDVSLRSGEAVARGLEEAGHEAVRVKISREGPGAATAAPVELAPGEGLLGADARLPRPARPLRRGRQRAGPARVARPSLRRLRRPLLGGLHGQADAEAALRPGWGPPGRLRRRRASRAGASAARRWACRSGSSPRGSAPASASAKSSSSASWTRRSSLARRHDPRVIVEASRRGPRGRVLAARQRGGRGLPARRGRRQRRLVRLRDQVPRRRHGAGRAGADPRRAAAPRARAGRHRLRAGRLLRPRPLRLLRRARRRRSSSTRSTPCPASPRPASTPSSGRPTGLDYPALCDRLVALAVERHQRARSYEF